MLPGKKYTPEDFVKVAWAHKWLIVIPALLAFAGAFVYSRSLPNRYRSEARVLIVPQQVPKNFVQPTVTARLDERLQSISQQILSRTRLEQLIDEFDLYPAQRKTMPMEDVVAEMRRDVGVEIPRTRSTSIDPGYFNVRYDSPNPRTAMRVAERLAAFFITENLQDREVLATQTSAFLRTQLDDARRRLIEHEQKLEVYRRRYGPELPTQVQSNLQMMQATQTELQRLVDTASRDQDRLVMLNRLLEEAAALQTAAASLREDETVPPAGDGAVFQKLEAARAALKNLELRLKPEHPDFVRAQRMVRELERQAEAEALEVPLTAASPGGLPLTPAEAAAQKRLAEIQAEQEMIERRVGTNRVEQDRLQAVLATYRERLEAVPTRESELIELMRDYGTLQETYTSLLSKTQDSDIASNLERRQIGQQFRVIDAARLPERPISPNRSRINLLGLLAGLALGIGLAALLEYRDTTFKTDGDIVSTLALPVLAVVPVMLTTDERRRASRVRLVAWSAAGVLALCAGGLAAWKLQLVEMLVR